MIKAHSPINWENEPSSNTPINETNLNKMDSTIGVLDDRIIEQETSKLDKSTAYTMVKDISFNENNGIFTVTRLNGSTFTIDTRLEKIAINFKYDYSTQKLIVTLVDGSTQSIDMSTLLTQYEFEESNTISWEVSEDGKVKANILDGSITENMLQPNYLAEIKLEAEKSAQSMANAKKSELNAKASEESAAASAERAENAFSNIKAENVKYGDSDVEAALDGFKTALSGKITVNRFSLNGDYKLSATSAILPFNKIYYSNPDFKANDDGTITYIGKVSCWAVVSANIYFFSGTVSNTNNKQFNILRNGSSMARALRTVITQYTSIDIGQYIIGINPGDILSVQYAGAVNDLISSDANASNFNIVCFH